MPTPTRSNPTLAPLLLPPADYYLQIAAGATIDYSLRYDKRLKGTHRYTIADTRGPLSLTIPISHPEPALGHNPTWGDIPLSEHGEWWGKHLTALESAYGRTPYFEFYIDRFLPLFSADTPSRFPSVAAMVQTANRIVMPILQLDKLPEVVPGPLPPYPQIRQDTLGFIGNLSILDTIFNLGPETPLYLALNKR